MGTFEFNRINRLPPYAFAVTNELKMQARRAGEDIVDMSMGNPDQPTPEPIVEKLIEAVHNSRNHRYSVSRGIYKLRVAISDWYKRRYDVDIDPQSEAIVTMGSKEGLAHLVLSIIDQGDIVLCPDPTYPIHAYSVVIAGGDLRRVPLFQGDDFFERLEEAYNQSWPRPKLMILNFPHNPTTEVVDLDFFQKVVDFALERNVLVIHDLAYADLCFDGYQAPSMLQIPEARKIAVPPHDVEQAVVNQYGAHIGSLTVVKPGKIIPRILFIVRIGYFPFDTVPDSHQRCMTAMCAVEVDQVLPDHWCGNRNITASRHPPYLFSGLHVVSTPVFIAIYNHPGLLPVKIDIGSAPV